jgi:hypothetical protein
MRDICSDRDRNRTPRRDMIWTSTKLALQQLTFLGRFLVLSGSVLDKTDTGRHQQDENEVPTSSVSQVALVMQWHLCHHQNPISEVKQCVGDMACWSSISPVRSVAGMCIKSST